MADRRVQLRMELRTLNDDEVLKRYCKAVGRRIPEERLRFARGMLDRDTMVDMIVYMEVK